MKKALCELNFKHKTFVKYYFYCRFLCNIYNKIQNIYECVCAPLDFKIIIIM